MFPKLNFPSVVLKTKEENGKVMFWDQLRKRYLVLNPEEWVRQHIVHYLIEQNYPKGLMKLEGGLSVNQLAKRTDIVVRDTEANVFLLIGCKAPDIKLNQKVVDQASVYNRSLNAKYMAVTNGLQWCCFEMDYTANSFTQIEGVPIYG